MTDSDEIKSIKAAIKDVHLDYMRGIISVEEYKKKTQKLVTTLIKVGGLPISPPKSHTLIESSETDRIHKAIRRIEFNYTQGIISVAEFSRKIKELRLRLVMADGSPAGDSRTHRTLRPMPRLKRTRMHTSITMARVVQAFRRLPFARHPRRYSLMFFMILLNLAARIPRVPHLKGYDGFVLAIQSYSLLNGYVGAWLIHPTSYLGMFTFSGYPMGSVTLLALCIAIGGSLDAGAFLYIAIFAVLSVPSSYMLMRYLFDDERTQWIAVVFYLFMPATYDFTYNTPTSRAIFFVILPIFILTLLKWSKDGKIMDLFQSLILIGISMLFHRMSIVLGIFVIVGLFYRLIKRVLDLEWKPGEARLLNRFMSILFLAFIVIIFPMSVVFSGVQPKNLLPEELFPEWSLPLARNLAGLVVDYALFFGFALVLGVYGIYLILRGIWKSTTLSFKTWENWALLLLFLLPLVYFIPSPAYTRHFLSPFVASFAGYGVMKLLEERGSSFYIISTIMIAPFVAFFQLYNAYWVDIEPYSTISTIILLTLFFGWLFTEPIIRRLEGREYSFGYHRKPGNLRIALLVLILLTFTITNADMRGEYDMEGTLISSYVTDEEIAIANFIREQHRFYPDRSILLCSHEIIEHRLAAYAESNCLSEGLGTALMEVGLVSAEDALANSTLDLFGNMFQPHWWEHADLDRTLPQRYWFYIFRNNYTDPEVQWRLSALHIRYFVGLKGTNESLYGFYGPFESPFRMYLSAPIVFETTNYLVYKLD